MNIIVDVISITTAPAGLKYTKTGNPVLALALVLTANEEFRADVEKMIIPIGEHDLGMKLVGNKVDCFSDDEVSFD